MISVTIIYVLNNSVSKKGNAPPITKTISLMCLAGVPRIEHFANSCSILHQLFPKKLLIVKMEKLLP